MLVGEPTLMGGELGDEDERLITRLENTQYKPVSDDDADFKPLSHPAASQAVQLYPGQQPIPNTWQPDSMNPGPRGGDPALPPSSG